MNEGMNESENGIVECQFVNTYLNILYIDT